MQGKCNSQKLGEMLHDNDARMHMERLGWCEKCVFRKRNFLRSRLHLHHNSGLRPATISREEMHHNQQDILKRFWVHDVSVSLLYTLFTLSERANSCPTGRDVGAKNTNTNIHASNARDGR